MASNTHIRTGSDHHNWKGGKRISSTGYVYRLVPDHPHSDCRGYIFEHILVAEKALGKYLDPGHPIHHVDENRRRNTNDNLVVCENNAYHKILHMRMRALAECGHANWRRCSYCKEYDLPENITVGYKMCFHPACVKKYRRNSYLKRKEKLHGQGKH